MFLLKIIHEHKFVRCDGSVFYGEASGAILSYQGILAVQVIIRDVTARKLAEEALQKVNDNLEKIVEERTAELLSANQSLKKEIAERKLAEEEKEKIQAQLLQAQKMEVLGKLVGGIAHDFNNIMASIKSLSTLGIKGTDSDSPNLHTYFKLINIAVDRAISITRQLLIFSRKQPVNLQPTNLNKIINDMLKILNYIIDENITIRTVLESHPWVMLADRGNVEQILMNLVINARDSMQGGGMIYIKTQNMIFEKEHGNMLLGSRSGNFVCLTVEDSGSGMDKEIINHLFEPFFTTKATGKGLGLGLAIVDQIVKGLNGVISVDSEPERGSIFKVYLPATTNLTLLEVEKKELEEASGRGERILLVEDDDILRISIQSILSNKGYSVLAIANAEEAEIVFDQEGNNFDLVFTDVLLPGKSGIYLVKQLLRRKSDLKVLFSSGYMVVESEWSYIQQGFHYLQKPFEPAILFMTIRNILDGR